MKALTSTERLLMDARRAARRAQKNPTQGGGTDPETTVGSEGHAAARSLRAPTASKSDQLSGESPSSRQEEGGGLRATRPFSPARAAQERHETERQELEHDPKVLGELDDYRTWRVTEHNR